MLLFILPDGLVHTAANKILIGGIINHSIIYEFIGPVAVAFKQCTVPKSHKIPRTYSLFTSAMQHAKYNWSGIPPSHQHLSSKTWSTMPSSGPTTELHCKTPSHSNVKEEGKLEAAEQMSLKTGSSAGHHLPSDQPNAGTTATSAERQRRKHISPQVDAHKTIIQRASVHAQTCLDTQLHNMQWRKMRGNGYWRERERERERNERQRERQSKWQEVKWRAKSGGYHTVKRLPEQTAIHKRTHTYTPHTEAGWSERWPNVLFNQTHVCRYMGTHTFSNVQYSIHTHTYSHMYGHTPTFKNAYTQNLHTTYKCAHIHIHRQSE